MRGRKLKKLWKRLDELQQERPTYETLLMKLGGAKKEAGRIAWGLMGIELPELPDKKDRKRRVDFTYQLNTDKLRKAIKREGRFLLPMTHAKPTQANFGNTTCNSPKWKKPSRTSKEIWESAPSSNNSNPGAKRTPSSALLPIAFR